jgi:hypothetical protein
MEIDPNSTCKRMKVKGLLLTVKSIVSTILCPLIVDGPSQFFHISGSPHFVYAFLARTGTGGGTFLAGGIAFLAGGGFFLVVTTCGMIGTNSALLISFGLPGLFFMKEAMEDTPAYLAASSVVKGFFGFVMMEDVIFGRVCAREITATRIVTMVKRAKTLL